MSAVQPRKVAMDISQLQNTCNWSINTETITRFGDAVFVNVRSPPNSPYLGREHKVKISYSVSYPATPAKYQFVTPIIHPKITKNGIIILQTFKNINIRNSLSIFQSLFVSMGEPMNLQTTQQALAYASRYGISGTKAKTNSKMEKMSVDSIGKSNKLMSIDDTNNNMMSVDNGNSTMSIDAW
eukprot:247538_1